MLKALLFALIVTCTFGASQVAVAQPERKPAPAIACRSIDTVRLLDMMISNRDRTSLDSYSEEQIRVGRCRLVEPGAAAMVERIEGGKSCLKLDNGYCYWVSTDVP
jgi:hypothetical protein